MEFKATEADLDSKGLDWHELRLELARVVGEKAWERAANHENGAGLGDRQPDLDSARWFLRRLLRKGKEEIASVFRSVLCGASWPRARFAQEGVEIDITCVRCGGAP